MISKTTSTSCEIENTLKRQFGKIRSSILSLNHPLYFAWSMILSLYSVTAQADLVYKNPFTDTVFNGFMRAFLSVHTFFFVQNWGSQALLTHLHLGLDLFQLINLINVEFGHNCLFPVQFTMVSMKVQLGFTTIIDLHNRKIYLLFVMPFFIPSTWSFSRRIMCYYNKGLLPSLVGRKTDICQSIIQSGAHIIWTHKA